MNILYIHQYFYTPEEGGGTRSYWIAKKMIERGHNVILVTSSKKYRKCSVVDVSGIKVIYIPGNYNNSLSNFAKMYEFLKFMFRSAIIGVKQKNIDLVYATSTPLSVGFPALVIKLFKGIPFVFEVRDLWPEFPIQIGAIRNQFIIWILRWFEKKIYLNAIHIVTLSPGMKEGVIEQGISETKVSMIPNMSKPDEFFPRSPQEDDYNKFGICNDKFNIIHFGAIAPANGLEYLIESAKLFKEKKEGDIMILYLGKGAQESVLKQMSRDYALDNVQFLGFMNMSDTSLVVNCCDISITSFKNLPILTTNSPNKLFDSFSAGIPCVVNSNGWTKELVEKYECGFYVNPDSPEEFVDKIIYYKQHPELLKYMGANARKLACTVFDKELLTGKVVDLLENVIREPQS